MMLKNKKIILGGTFDIIHKGHKALLKKAFQLGRVTIGLTSDRFAKKLKDHEINFFKERKKNLESFIQKNFFQKAKIIKINDIFGPTLKQNFDIIVVSQETFRNALKINEKRKALGKKEIEIVKIDLLLADDQKPISSTRIRNGEIDTEGRICPFCQIVQGKLKSLKILETKDFLAFLDKKPRSFGHTLVIPKKHFRWVWDVENIGNYFHFAKKIADGLKRALKTEVIFLIAWGEEIGHAHLHLIPKTKKNHLTFPALPVQNIPPKEMRQIQIKIKKSFKNIRISNN